MHVGRTECDVAQRRHFKFAVIFWVAGYASTTEVGEIGINLEELKLEHSPSAQIGLVELQVVPEAEASLIADLQKRGWRIA